VTELTIKVKEIVADVLAIGADEIDTNANLLEAFGLDSLEVVDIASRLEDETGVHIDPSNFPRMTSVSDICALLSASMAEVVT
jgi:acyl carrier protein